MKAAALALVIAAMTSTAFAQANPDDHNAHHPGGAAPGGAAVAPAPVPPHRNRQDDLFSDQVNRMREAHSRMQLAKTAAERKAIADEQMKLMQSGMDMMSQMRGGMGMGGMAMGMGTGGSGSPGGMGASPTPAAPQAASPMAGMEGMMGMHTMMERRVALIEQMMQMMVDRETAIPRK